MFIEKKWGKGWVKLHTGNIPAGGFLGRIHYPNGATEARDMSPSEIDSETLWLKDPNVSEDRFVSRGRFRRLFTMEEKRAIKQSADVDVQIFADDVLANDSINLDYSATIMGMGLLVSLKILTEARKTAILANELP